MQQFYNLLMTRNVRLIFPIPSHIKSTLHNEQLITHCLTLLPSYLTKRDSSLLGRETPYVSPPVTRPSALVDLIAINICNKSLTYRKYNGIRSKAMWKLVYSGDGYGYSRFLFIQPNHTNICSQVCWDFSNTFDKISPVSLIA